MMLLITIVALLIDARWSIALAGLAWLVGYAASCWWFPRSSCACCHGKGKHWTKDSKKFRYCFWCNGKGSFYRFGRRMWNATVGARRLDDRV